MESDTLFQKKETIEKQHTVWVEWQQPYMPWNEICIKVMEVFGLPGNRYTTHPSTHYMAFKFNSEKDRILCEILLSEYIVQ